jgi:hypothetical protein
MKELKSQIADEQVRVGVRVIKPPHAFGFLDKDLCDEPLVPVASIADAAKDKSESPVDVTSEVLGG